MRPDRAAMVAQRIEDALTLRQRSPAPAGMHVRLHQAVGDGTRAVSLQRTGKKQVPRIRGDDLALLLLAVQGEGEESVLRHPKRLLDAALYLRGFALKAVSGRRIANMPQQARHPVFGIV